MAENEEVPALPYVVLGDGVTASDYALKNLNAALGKAQDEFTPAIKDMENKYSAYKYVPLNNIISSSRPALSKNHLTVMQFPSADLERKTVTLTTRMVHWDSGEWVQSVLELPGELALGKDGAMKFNQQTIGGGTTYARKIAYKPIVGVSDSDDDIDAGQEQGDTSSRPKKTTPAEALRTAPKASQTQAQPKDTQPAQQTQQPATEQQQGIFKMLPAGELICVIKGLTKKETTPKKAGDKPKPYLVVTFNGMLRPEQDEHKASVNHGFCYDTALFDALTAGSGKECKLQVDTKGKFVKVTDTITIDGVEYVDGKVFVAPAEEETPEP